MSDTFGEFLKNFLEKAEASVVKVDWALSTYFKIHEI
jgi:D-hexose-6-phosphate mutarotase